MNQYGKKLMGILDWSTRREKLLSIAIVERFGSGNSIGLDTPSIKILSNRDTVDAYYDRLATDSLRQCLPATSIAIHVQYYLADEILIPIINGSPDIKYAVYPDFLELIIHKPSVDK